MSNLVQIMIVDDHTLFRSGLKKLLQIDNTVSVVAEAASASEALELLKTEAIDLILMDITLIDMDGLEATKLIKKEYPNIKIIILTMHKDEPYLMEALKAGATGYILKEAATTELATAIRAVMDGEITVAPSLMKVLVNKAINGNSEYENSNSKTGGILTTREIEVLKYICLGYTSQEAADILVISVKTVEKHKEHIMEKLNLKRRYQLIDYAIKEGLFTLEP
ncbi:MAG: response regulator transcription factor [Bacillota bacterium]|nr:response regulator transcription factor [Bacillota bacterium]